MATATPRTKSTHGPTRHVYDVIVLGGQLGGALAAALLAKRGYSVLLVEHDGMGPGYEHGGYLLPYAPHVMPPFKGLPILEEALTELGLNTQVARLLRPHAPELQLVLPRQRVDLHADEARRKAELARAFGDEGAGLFARLASAGTQHEATDALLKDLPALPPSGMMETWALNRWIKQHPQLEAGTQLTGDDAPARLLRGLLPFVTHLPGQPAGLALGRALSQTLRGPHRFPAGKEGLRELLNKRLVELGGDLLAHGHSETYIAESLAFDGSKFEGVRLLRQDTLYRGGVLLGATDAQALRRLIPDKRSQRDLGDHLDASTTPSFVFTVNWVLPEAALPRGLGELVLYDTEDAELGPLLLQTHPARLATALKDPYIQLVPAGKEARGGVREITPKDAEKREAEHEEEGMRVVCAGAVVPASARELGEENLRAVADRIDAHLDVLMPFAARHRKLRSAPYLDASGVRGSRLMPHPHYAFEGEAFLGVTGLRQRTPVKNVVLGGREILPGLGTEGEVIAGVRAVRLVQELFKKKAVL